MLFPGKLDSATVLGTKVRLPAPELPPFCWIVAVMNSGFVGEIAPTAASDTPVMPSAVRPTVAAAVGSCNVRNGLADIDPRRS